MFVQESLHLGVELMNNKLSKEIIEFENNYQEEIIEILAVTGASGLGGGKLPKEDFWTASIDILAWKENIKHSILKIEKTILRFKADDEFLNEMGSKIKANSIVKLKIRKGERGFLLCEPLECDILDNELKVFLEKQLEPVFYMDEVFGEFELDKSVNVFEKTIEWCCKEVRISFDNDDESEIKSILETGHVLYRDQKDWMRKICDFACDKLLDLKNDVWLDDEKEEITREEFIEAIELCDISLEPDGAFTFWFDDGDLFWGHSIIAEGNIDGTLHDAHIAG